MKLKNKKIIYGAVAVVCAAAVGTTTIFLNNTRSNNGPVKAKTEIFDDVASISRQVAAEGCVLLKNDNNTLPYKDGIRVSVFGRTQNNYYKSGTGSGGLVIAPYVVDIMEGLRKNSSVKINEDLAEIYSTWNKENPIVDEGGWATTPWSQEEMPLTDKLVKDANAVSDAALVIIGRTAGEDKDNTEKSGSFLLTEQEKDMLSKVSKTFDKVTVILNVSNIIDMKWVDEYPIDAVMYVWQGGMIGGDAVADVITGDVNPSGHLTDTIAYNYEDYPSSDNYGGIDINKYEEDIYVGYRYFETFAKDKVMYPFGFGLSYTTFNTNIDEIKDENGQIVAKVTVENTGDVAGKEVVQIYYEAPNDKLGNPSRELAAYAKTKLLQPGEKETIEISYNINDMASYDDSGATGFDSAYVLEAGEYNIYVGENARDSKLAYTYNQESLEVTEQFDEECAPTEVFNRIKNTENGKKQEKVPTKTSDVKERVEGNMPEEIKQTGDKGHKLLDVYNGDVRMTDFIAQLSDTDLLAIIRGEGMSPWGVTPGVAGAFGGVTNSDGENLADKYGIARVACADGPSGIRSSYESSSLPIGTCIACTWNLELVERLFQMEGTELVDQQVDCLLGPGLNIHRNPLNGRNFEYFSEDPLITGTMAAAVTKGLQSAGATVTLKHFAGNNQEVSRNNYDTVVSERALREIYLKGFEIAVKTSKPRAIMTSYNKLNGYYTASNYELDTMILRKEWGYDGILMTDWWANKNADIYDLSNEEYGQNRTASMVKAQNDLDMVSVDDTDTEARLNEGYLTRSELQRSAINVCNYVMKSQAFFRLNEIEFKPYETETTDWFSTNKDKAELPTLKSITVGEKNVDAFYVNRLEYKVFNTLEGDIPEVKATANGKAQVTVKQATADDPTAKIYVDENGNQIIYRVIFTNSEGVEPIFNNATFANLDEISVNGQKIEGFDCKKYAYFVPVDSLDSEPKIEYSSKDGVDVKVTYDEENKISTVTCTSKDQLVCYRIGYGEKPHSDEFDGTDLGAFWTVENEEGSEWSLDNGALSVNTIQGSNFSKNNNGKNIFTQPAYGNWQVIAKLTLDTASWEKYQNAGIGVVQDEDNYVLLKAEMSDAGLKLAWCNEKGGVYSTVSEILDTAAYSDTFYLKIKKLGDAYTAYVSSDGENFTQLEKRVTVPYDEPRFAMMVSNTEVVKKKSAQRFESVTFENDLEIPVTEISDSAKIKVAELDPAEITDVLQAEPCEDEDGGMNLGYCEKDQYIIYNIDVKEDGEYNVTARVASNEADTAQMELAILVDNDMATSFITNGTGGYQSWKTTDAKIVKLTKGRHQLKVLFNSSGMNLNWIKFDKK